MTETPFVQTKAQVEATQAKERAKAEANAAATAKEAAKAQKVADARWKEVEQLKAA